MLILALAFTVTLGLCACADDEPDSPSDEPSGDTPASPDTPDTPSTDNPSGDSSTDSDESGTVGLVFSLSGDGYSVTNYTGNDTDVIIPSTYKGKKVTAIGEGAFYMCETIQSISIPNSVTAIGYDAFYDCSSLSYNEYDNAYYLGNNENPYLVLVKALNKSIPTCTINCDTKLICSSAFQECGALTNITIPNSVTYIGENAFLGCCSLESITVDPSNTAYKSIDGNLYTKDGSALISYATGKTNTSFTIPNSVTFVGESAFNRCLSLTNITIPSGVTSIGERAFDNCQSLTNITIPSGVTHIGDYAFFSCYSLESITIPNSVTYIGDFAFSNCNSLVYNEYDNAYYLGNNENPYLLLVKAKNTSITSCTINDNTGLIYYSAFSDCPLTEISIPNNVTSIDDYAFADCKSLKSVTMGNSVTSIGIMAFSCCTSLKSVTMGNSVTHIGKGAFYDCSFTTITIPASVTTIGDSAFGYCSQLERVYICDIAKWCAIKFDSNSSNPLTSAGKLYMAGSDTPITELVIPEGVTSIPICAFASDAIVSVTIPNSVTSIGNYAFAHCMFTNLTIPNSVTSIGFGAFNGCNLLESISIPNGVTSIDPATFSGCDSLGSISIPNTVTSIGNNAFANCNSLTSVIIPNSVTHIGNYAFSYCNSLVYNEYDNAYYLGNNENPYLLLVKAKNTSITTCAINSNTRFIYSDAFADCTSLDSITIPNSITSIGNKAFAGCTSITGINFNATAMNDLFFDSNVFHKAGRNGDGIKVTIGKNVTKIPAYLFHIYISWVSGGSDCYDYPKITSVEFEKGSLCTSIGGQAFDNCSFISLSIPNGVTSIGVGAFSDCTSLTSVTIPNSVTSIGSGAFSDCTSLESVTIPNSVTYMGDSAFYNCTSLNEINFNATAMNDLFFHSKAFRIVGESVNGTKVTIGKNVTRIPAYLFSGSEIISVEFENDSICTYIGKEAFSCCSLLESITIPNSVTYIGSEAFESCSSLKSVTFENTSGWWYGSSDSATSGTGIPVAYLENASTAANVLRSTYCGYTWKRS